MIYARHERNPNSEMTTIHQIQGSGKSVHSSSSGSETEQVALTLTERGPQRTFQEFEV